MNMKGTSKYTNDDFAMNIVKLKYEYIMIRTPQYLQFVKETSH